MKEKKPSTLHITFHNPNSEEETVKQLTKLIAVGMAQQAVTEAPKARYYSKKYPKASAPERRIAI